MEYVNNNFRTIGVVKGKNKRFRPYKVYFGISTRKSTKPKSIKLILKHITAICIYIV